MIFHCPVQISYVYLNEIKVVVVLNISGSLDKSPVDYQRNRKKLQSTGSTLAWWNIFSIFDTIAVSLIRNLDKTSTKLLSKSAPYISAFFTDTPECFAVQLNTICSLLGLLISITGWCGKNQKCPGLAFFSSALLAKSHSI